MSSRTLAVGLASRLSPDRPSAGCPGRADHQPRQRAPDHQSGHPRRHVHRLLGNVVQPGHSRGQEGQAAERQLTSSSGEFSWASSLSARPRRPKARRSSWRRRRSPARQSHGPRRRRHGRSAPLFPDRQDFKIYRVLQFAGIRAELPRRRDGDVRLRAADRIRAGGLRRDRACALSISTDSAQSLRCEATSWLTAFERMGGTSRSTCPSRRRLAGDEAR